MAPQTLVIRAVFSNRADAAFNRLFACGLGAKGFQEDYALSETKLYAYADPSTCAKDIRHGERVIVVNVNKCGHCGACVAVCPTNSMELIESSLMIGDACTTCGTCASVCPMGALTALEDKA